MEVMKKMYLHLFNQITNAIYHMEAQNYGLARQTLENAQQVTEEMFLEAEEAAGNTAQNP